MMRQPKQAPTGETCEAFALPLLGFFNFHRHNLAGDGVHRDFSDVFRAWRGEIKRPD